MHPTESLSRLVLLGIVLTSAALLGTPARAQTQAPTPVQAQLGLEQLFELMAKQTRVSTTFTEQKRIKGLDTPVESSGELLFEAPSRMIKRTLTPRLETLALDGRQATVERGRQTRTVSLDDEPELAIHVEGLRACLAGDRATLERLYHLSLNGSLAQWKLTLVPREAKASQQVEAIFLSGEQADIRVVQVLLSDGDASITRIERPRR